MKIIEARDGFIKFDAENIYLSSFVMTEDTEKSYVAQVVQIKEQAGEKIGFAKILYLYNGELFEYDKTLPSAGVNLIECTKDIISHISIYETPIIAGKTFQNDLNIAVDASILDKKLLVSVDSEDDNNILARNLLRQSENLGKKTIIVDTLGIIKAKKYTAGVDFKLPLDTASLAFLYEDCLGDATSDSKATIIDIFKELSEYSKTVPFVPFGTLKNIVDDMVDHSHVFKLLVLKNKLAKLDKLGYFAAKKEQVEKFYQIINQKSAVIDLSKLNPPFLNRYLSFIYEAVQTKDDIQIILELSNSVSKKNIKTALTSDAATVCITHSNFKYLNDIKTLFSNFIIVPSPSNNNIFKQYSIFLKYMEKGTCLVAGEALSNVPLVSKLELIEDTPQISVDDQDDEVLEEIAELDESSEDDIAPKSEIFNTIEEKSEEAIAEAVENIELPENIEMFTEEADDETDDTLENNELDAEEDDETLEVVSEENSERSEQNVESEEPQASEDEITELELDLSEEFAEEDVKEELTDSETTEAEPIQTEIIETDLELPEETAESVLESDLEPQEQAEPLAETVEEISPAEESDKSEELIPEIVDDENQEFAALDSSEFEMEEITELNPEEADDNDIVIDMGDAIEEGVDEEVDEQIVQDVDKVFTTMKETDEISDSDLDFIDELNSDDDVILEEVSDDEAVLDELSKQDDEEEGIIENNFVQETYELPEEEPESLEVKDSSTPIVPVYDADIPQEDLVMSDPIEQGDNVVHAKYGNGVVEKMIKYGSKTLYSINFENLGRRLLDPTLTEIKKA